MIWITDIFFSRIVITVSHSGSKQPEIATKKFLPWAQQQVNERATEQTIEQQSTQAKRAMRVNERLGWPASGPVLTTRVKAVLNNRAYPADRMAKWRSMIYELTPELQSSRAHGKEICLWIEWVNFIYFLPIVDWIHSRKIHMQLGKGSDARMSVSCEKCLSYSEPWSVDFDRWFWQARVSSIRVISMVKRAKVLLLKYCSLRIRNEPDTNKKTLKKKIFRTPTMRPGDAL